MDKVILSNLHTRARKCFLYFNFLLSAIKKRIILGWLLIGAIACTRTETGAFPNEPVKTEPEGPKVSIVYASLFDEVCSSRYSYPIKQEWKDELLKRLPQLRMLFARDGLQLLNAAIALVEKPFIDRSFRVSLSLCSFPSISAPLIVNARYGLRSFTPEPISDDVLIGTVVHEILHNYLDSVSLSSTPLTQKYHGENNAVVNHLHLFALQKAIYLKLGWPEKLNEIVKKDRSLPNGDYKRAWDIVNDREDYTTFLQELKVSPAKSLDF